MTSFIVPFVTVLKFDRAPPGWDLVAARRALSRARARAARDALVL